MSEESENGVVGCGECVRCAWVDEAIEQVKDVEDDKNIGV